MKYRTRTFYTDKQKSEMWDRWQRGESMSSIGRHFNDLPVRPFCGVSIRQFFMDMSDEEMGHTLFWLDLNNPLIDRQGLSQLIGSHPLPGVDLRPAVLFADDGEEVKAFV